MTTTTTPPDPERLPTFSTRFLLGGYEFSASIPLDKANQLATVIDRLRAMGAEPIISPRPPELAPDGSPICPRHRVPMRRREKQGDTWYSHQVVDRDGVELFCKGYHGPDSLGWEVPPVAQT